MQTTEASADPIRAAYEASREEFLAKIGSGFVAYESYKEGLARIAERERRHPVRSMILHSGPGTMIGVLFGLIAGMLLASLVGAITSGRRSQSPSESRQAPLPPSRCMTTSASTSGRSAAPSQAVGDSKHGSPAGTAVKPSGSGSATTPARDRSSHPAPEGPSL